MMQNGLFTDDPEKAQRRLRLAVVFCLCMVGLVLFAVFGAKSRSYDPDTLIQVSAPGITAYLPTGTLKRKNSDVALYAEWSEGMLIAGCETDDILTENGLDPAMSLPDYADLCAARAEGAERFTDEKGNEVFTYIAPRQNSKDLFFYTVTLRGSDAFWCLNFVCTEDLADTYRPYFADWASRAEVN